MRLLLIALWLLLVTRSKWAKSLRIGCSEKGGAIRSELPSGSSDNLLTIEDKLSGKTDVLRSARYTSGRRTQYKMLLTGYSDIGATIEAVNEGNLFRYLTKPCEKEVLINAINMGVAQYLSIMAEKELIMNARKSESQQPSGAPIDLASWENFESPISLPRSSQAESCLDSLLGIDHQCYLVLLKLTTLQTMEQR